MTVQVAVPAAQGQNGNFMGVGTGGNQVYVETDVGSYSTFGLSLLDPGATDSVNGLTLKSNPHLNYVANNLSPKEMYPETWLHELGHALDLITSSKSSESSANAFENYVIGSGRRR